MESLRTQMKDWQDAYNQREQKCRELYREQKLWEQEKRTLQARLQQLEAENQRLQRVNGAGPAAILARATDAGVGADAAVFSAVSDGLQGQGQGQGDNDTITITRSRMKEIDGRYQKVIALLTEKTKLCEALQQQLHHGGSADGTPKIVIIPAPPTLTSDEQVVTHWNLLRERIRSLTLERFNQKLSNPVSDKNKQEFTQLSPNWKTYMSTPSLTCYLFRALIWRYLHTCLFGAGFGRVWGRDTRNLLAQLSGLFSSPSPSSSPAAKKSTISSITAADAARLLRDWQMHTAALLERAREVDVDITGELVDKICDAIAPFATEAAGGSGVDPDPEGLRKAIHQIVAMSAELSAAFARAPFVVLMSDEPGSTRTQGFEYREATMDVRGRIGTKGPVDMMVSPCLLKKGDDYEVLVKAEVVC